MQGVMSNGEIHTSKKIGGSLQIRPLKFNMEPENGPLEKEIPFGKPSIFRFHVKLWGCKVSFFGECSLFQKFSILFKNLGTLATFAKLEKMLYPLKPPI